MEARAKFTITDREAPAKPCEITILLNLDFGSSSLERYEHCAVRTISQLLLFPLLPVLGYTGGTAEGRNDGGYYADDLQA